MRRGGAGLALVLLAGCGGGGEGGPNSVEQSGGSGPLAWESTPQAFVTAGKPRDRVMLASVINNSLRPVKLDAAKISVRDANGRTLRSFGQYIGSFAHGLYGAYQKPTPLPPDELTRLGLKITLKPGKVAPLAVSWRLPPGAREPAILLYGSGQLRLPAKARPAE